MRIYRRRWVFGLAVMDFYHLIFFNQQVMNYIRIDHYRINEKGVAVIEGKKFPFVISGDEFEQYLSFPNYSNACIFEKLGFTSAYDFYQKYNISYQNDDGVWPYTYGFDELEHVITLINQVFQRIYNQKIISIF